MAGNETYSAELLGVTAAGAFLISIVGTAGNLLAVVALLQNTKLRQNPSTAFMVNLPACLLPVCALGMPLFGLGCLQRQLYGRILIPEKVILAFFSLGFTLSQVHIHTICALAFNRLVAVMWPLKYKQLMQPRKVRVYLGLLWLYSMLLWLPIAFGVLGKVVDQSDCGASLGNTKITDLVFADDAVIFAESLEVLVMALEALHEEANPLGPEVNWLKTKVQAFGGLEYEEEELMAAMNESQGKVLKGIHVLFTYMLPILFTATCYIAMYLKVRYSKSRQARNRRQGEDDAVVQWEDHVTKTILVIFVFMVLCCVPHLVMHIRHLYKRHTAAWLLLHLVFWLQYCIDPLVYVTISSQYRAACAETVGRLMQCLGLSRISHLCLSTPSSITAQYV
ncbi:G-protein coupled receptor moody [Chionoecetes opilio]|uniref:G-protein coupled receptor moody n=1 Tax=Chionoecetes opilio TaxID=41210 RepID=A0A8J4Y8P2_CHIOP|nr:G-protein coupled receptor moody [Chionoecetes opilio]